MRAGIFLLIQSCLSVLVLERCECDGVLEEAPFQVLTFCWGVSPRWRCFGLVAGRGRSVRAVLGSARRRWLLPACPGTLLKRCFSPNAAGEMQEPSSKLMKKNQVTIPPLLSCQTATAVVHACVQVHQLPVYLLESFHVTHHLSLPGLCMVGRCELLLLCSSISQSLAQ